jgi:type IV fimbrial biogenesis protein FimT
VVSVKTMAFRPHAGFTMIEMLVAMGVLGILIAVAGPALSGMASSQQVRSASYDIYSTLTHARSEALTRNASVTVAPTEGDWARGWTITDSGGTVLHRQSAYSRVTLSGPAQIIFSAEGRPSSTATPFAFSAPDVDATNFRCVRLRLNGRSTITRGPCP